MMTGAGGRFAGTRTTSITARGGGSVCLVKDIVISHYPPKENMLKGLRPRLTRIGFSSRIEDFLDRRDLVGGNPQKVTKCFYVGSSILVSWFFTSRMCALDPRGPGRDPPGRGSVLRL
eukprot:1196340-Prorocentrum_minimum.AAC.10